MRHRLSFDYMHAKRRVGKFRVAAMAVTLVAALAVAALGLSGCAKPEKLRIGVSNWIGYTPLIYLHEKGLLKDRLEISVTESIGDSLNLYEAGFIDGFCGTQYEAEYANLVGEDTLPFMLFDRSRGADVVLSNRALTAIADERNVIDVYLEIGSVNLLLFREFARLRGLQERKFIMHNVSQAGISLMQPSAVDTQIIVTYEPYATALGREGFLELATTAEVDLLVLDALYLRPEAGEQRIDLVRDIERRVSAALEVLRTNPEDFYGTVKPYLGGQNYPEFIASVKKVEWLAGPVSPELAEFLQQNGVVTKWLTR